MRRRCRPGYAEFGPRSSVLISSNRFQHCVAPKKKKEERNKEKKSNLIFYALIGVVRLINDLSQGVVWRQRIYSLKS